MDWTNPGHWDHSRYRQQQNKVYRQDRAMKQAEGIYDSIAKILEIRNNFV